MATPGTYHILPMHTSGNNPGEAHSDISYLPSAPMHQLPPPSYTIAAAPPSASSYPPLPPPPPPMYSSAPAVVTQMHTQYQGIFVPANVIHSQTAHIRDYFAWSVTNIFLGGCVLGWIAVLLSIQTRKRKDEGDIIGASAMSKITLTCNILITIIFFATGAFGIIYGIYVMQLLNN